MRPSQTKIVATLGPAILSVEKLVELLIAGVDVFRINAAHGDVEKFAAMLALVRQAESESGIPVAVLMDLAGPKMRLGEIPGGELRCNLGDTIRFVRGHKSKEPNWLTSTYEPLVDELNVGDRVLMCDGLVAVKIDKKVKSFVEGKVIESGTVRSRQGINLPGVKLSVKSLQEVDKINAAWGAQNGVDYLGFSFVRSAAEIRELREIIVKNTPKSADGSSTSHSSAIGTGIVAKIEKPEAVEKLDEIVQAADAVMVARGDLGVELDIAQMGVVQKEIIQKCRQYQKPVIVATQMLESMTHSPIPTRAEVSDVANAVFDGADAVMLSGETAVGEFPLETVQMMHRIAQTTETAEIMTVVPQQVFAIQKDNNSTVLRSSSVVASALATAAVDIASDIEADLIVAATYTGRTALDLSQLRCIIPTVGFSPNVATVRRMCLYWGIIPLLMDKEDSYESMIQKTLKSKLTQKGKSVVLLTGTNVFENSANGVSVVEM